MPFLCVYPPSVPAGTIDDSSVIGAVDMLPTLCDMAGVGIPDTHRLDGENVRAAFEGGTHTREKSLVWEFACHPMYGHVINKSPVLAIRRGDYKLLLNPEKDRVELYNVAIDRSELKDLAEDQPEIVEQLSRELISWYENRPELVRNFKAGSNAYRWPGE